MADFLHTMVRITDPDRTRAFYEALGCRFERDMDIVRNGEREAANYFYGIRDQDAVLELTFNHDGRTYDLGTGYGHIAIGVDDLDGTLERLAAQGIEPERPPSQVREGGPVRGSSRRARAGSSSTSPTRRGWSTTLSARAARSRAVTPRRSRSS